MKKMNILVNYNSFRAIDWYIEILQSLMKKLRSENRITQLIFSFYKIKDSSGLSFYLKSNTDVTKWHPYNISSSFGALKQVALFNFGYVILGHI